MLLDWAQSQLHELQKNSRHRQLRVCVSPCQPESTQLTAHQSLAGEAPVKKCLAFASNDYLGLANHAELIEAWGEGAKRWGVGSGASHLLGGHSAAHDELEQILAHWQAPYIPKARALFFSTGYMANLALLGSMGLAKATFFCDKLNHASLIDGVHLAAGQCKRYPHRNMARLRELLAQSPASLKLIVTDAVFSMDGSQADLSELLRLAQLFDAWVVIDDAHGFGVVGEHGQGSLAHNQVCSERLIYMATLGKAVGVAGAFVVAHEVLIDWMINSARSYIYTTAAPAALAYTILRSLQLVQGGLGQQRRSHLQALIEYLRHKRLGPTTQDVPLQLGHTLLAQDALNIAIGDEAPELSSQACVPVWLHSDTPIQPLIVGGDAQALQCSQRLEEQGIWVPAIRPPTVPLGSARLRVSLSASHSFADIDALLAALE